MLTLLSYFAFLTSVLTSTLASFVGLNKIQILQLSVII
uniref:Cytochrome b6-f complex subunit 6 n=1 Tax=Histiopteris incisa TaxID=32090 RepID=A0A3G5CUY9_9MONI|nr:cytochrome b6/f complex subunit VI [Histiopteris incisa]AYW16709.1 cytochrome b6/f complex subunit VI [Histiopteris incisa]